MPTDAFELWCWRRLLRVPWTARRSSQSILKEINPEYSLEGLMLKLKLQYFGQLTHWKRPWCWERLKAGREGTTEDEMVGCHHLLSGPEFENLLELVMDREAWRAAIHGVAKSRTWVSEWTELNWTFDILWLWIKQSNFSRRSNALFSHLSRYRILSRVPCGIQ